MLYNSLLLHLRTPQCRAHKYKYHIAGKYCPALAYKYSGAQLWALDPRGCYTNLKRDGQRGEMMGMGGEGKIEKTFHSKSWFSFARMPSYETYFWFQILVCRNLPKVFFSNKICAIRGYQPPLNGKSATLTPEKFHPQGLKMVF